jgi:hypothetical protein
MKRETLYVCSRKFRFTADTWFTCSAAITEEQQVLWDHCFASIQDRSDTCGDRIRDGSAWKKMCALLKAHSLEPKETDG